MASQAHDMESKGTTKSSTTPVGQVMADAPESTGASTGSGSITRKNVHESALQHLNVDDSDELDSAMGDMARETSMMSLNSSIYDYVEENGRTYHRYKEGKYMLPNDEEEKDRLDLQHQLWMITLYDELFLSPIKNPQRVLDIGTGTGIWAIEFANRYPSAKVTGTDLSPIQPEYVPSNCNFEVDDCEDEWNYTQKFDLIHGRALVACFQDHAAVFKQAYKSLAPGGYFEMQDLIIPMRAIDNTLKGTAVEKWADISMKAAEKLGMSWKSSAHYVRYFEEAGFVDVVERHFQWPMNTWPKGQRLKMLGSYWLEDVSNGLEGMTMAVLTRGEGMSKEEVIAMTVEVRKNLKDKKIHAYCPVIVVYGRKPL